MPMLQQFRLYAEYNRLMNSRILEAAGRLTDDQLEHDRGAFFKSVLGTLNHVLVGDLVWLKRFQGHPPSAAVLAPLERYAFPPTLDSILFPDLVSLRVERDFVDALLIDWIAQLTDADLADDLSYRNMAGEPQCKPVVSLVSHLFLHQVHHRGQATTLLSQFDVDFGETDLLELIPESDA